MAEAEEEPAADFLEPLNFAWTKQDYRVRQAVRDYCEAANALFYAEDEHPMPAITSNHFDDADGNPAGGSTYGVGFAISWQNGPLGRGEARQEPNGAFVEDIIKAAMDRIDYYQKSRFASDYNSEALSHLCGALDALNARTANREARGVEGTHAE